MIIQIQDTVVRPRTVRKIFVQWFLVGLVCYVVSGCTIGTSVVTRKQPEGPLVPTDNSILQTDLSGGVDENIVGAKGSVWHVTLTDEKRQLDHWLVLYPDGKFVTSLCDERAWREHEDHGPIVKLGDAIMINLFTRPFGGEEAAAKQKAEFRSEDNRIIQGKVAENASRVRIIESKDPARLMKEIREICKPVWTFPKIGRFAFSDGMLRLNVLELHPPAGAGLANYDTTGVSQLVFEPGESGTWILDADQSKTVWRSNYGIVDKVIRSDHLILYSTRGRYVVLTKIEDFAAPQLPNDWEW